MFEQNDYCGGRSRCTGMTQGLVVLYSMHHDEKGRFMRSSLRTWIWCFLVVWGILLISLAEAKAEDATLSAVQQKKLMDASDAAQSAGREYVKKQQVYIDLAKKMTSDSHFPEGTTYKVNFDPAKCVALPGGDVKCPRSIVPVFPKKSDVNPSSVTVPEKK